MVTWHMVGKDHTGLAAGVGCTQGSSGQQGKLTTQIQFGMSPSPNWTPMPYERNVVESRIIDIIARHKALWTGIFEPIALDRWSIDNRRFSVIDSLNRSNFEVVGRLLGSI
jgi:hypothetical protein